MGEGRSPPDSSKPSPGSQPHEGDVLILGKGAYSKPSLAIEQQVSHTPGDIIRSYESKRRHRNARLLPSIVLNRFTFDYTASETGINA